MLIPFHSGRLLEQLCGSQRPNLGDQLSHIILDEIHERELHTDVLLRVVKQVLHANPKLKLILMSATMDTGRFSKYFENCPVVCIHGRTFNLDVSYLEDIIMETKYTDVNERCERKNDVNHDLCFHLIQTIHQTCALNEKILVFLPGMNSIIEQNDKLENLQNVNIVFLHSEVDEDGKDDVDILNSRQSPSVRTVILATNIAEASITVSDAVHVIDSGLIKRMDYDPITDTNQLNTVRIARANADQRAGRVGRTRPGRCYRLYSKQTYDEMEDYAPAEIQRSRLSNTCLYVNH